MKLEEKILKRLDKLVTQGDAIDMETSGGHAESKIAHQWATSCLTLINKVFGGNSAYYLKFDNLYENITFPGYLSSALGIVKAAKEDFELDLLFNTRTLIEAEVFDDFLEQSEYLLKAEYYQAAAVIAGAVLEDALRKLCIRQDIDIPEKPKADKLNADLAKSGIYNKLQQKQITALLDLRNKAAHGEWDAFEINDVEGMLHNVRAFMMKHFS